MDAAASGGRWGRVGYCGKKRGGGGFKRGVDWTWGGGSEDGCRGSIMFWLQCAGKAICRVRSRLWQHSIFIITVAISFYNSCRALLLSFSLSPLFSSFSLSFFLSLSLSLSLYLPFPLASQVEREARVDDGIGVSR